MTQVWKDKGEHFAFVKSKVLGNFRPGNNSVIMRLNLWPCIICLTHVPRTPQCPVWLTSPANDLMLFLPKDKIFRFSGRTKHPITTTRFHLWSECVWVCVCSQHSLRPLRFVIFSMQFVDRDSFLWRKRHNNTWWIWRMSVWPKPATAAVFKAVSGCPPVLLTRTV